MHSMNGVGSNPIRELEDRTEEDFKQGAGLPVLSVVPITVKVVRGVIRSAVAAPYVVASAIRGNFR